MDMKRLQSRFVGIEAAADKTSKSGSKKEKETIMMRPSGSSMSDVSLLPSSSSRPPGDTSTTNICWNPQGSSPVTPCGHSSLQNVSMIQQQPTITAAATTMVVGQRDKANEQSQERQQQHLLSKSVSNMADTVDGCNHLMDNSNRSNSFKNLIPNYTTELFQSNQEQAAAKDEVNKQNGGSESAKVTLAPSQDEKRLLPSLQRLDISRTTTPRPLTNSAMRTLTSPTSGLECWICYDSERSDAGPLIQPCSCKGDVSSVHHDCLKQWLMESTTTPGRTSNNPLINPEALIQQREASMATTTIKCHVCNEPYTFERTGSVWLPAGLTTKGWIKTSIILIIMSLTAMAFWFTVNWSDHFYVRVIGVGLTILVEYICLRFLGFNMIIAYNRAKVAAYRITGRTRNVAANVSTLNRSGSPTVTALIRKDRSSGQNDGVDTSRQKERSRKWLNRSVNDLSLSMSRTSSLSPLVMSRTQLGSSCGYISIPIDTSAVPTTTTTSSTVSMVNVSKVSNNDNDSLAGSN